MSRDASLVVVIGAVLVVLAAAAAVGAYGTTRTTSRSEVSGQIPEPPIDGSTGVVMGLMSAGGQRILGLRLHSRSFEAQVGFAVGRECFEQYSSGGPESSGQIACGNLPAHADVSGSGTTATGTDFLIVRIAVSQDCYEALSIGDTWPASAEACA